MLERLQLKIEQLLVWSKLAQNQDESCIEIWSCMNLRDRCRQSFRSIWVAMCALFLDHAEDQLSLFCVVCIHVEYKLFLA